MSGEHDPTPRSYGRLLAATGQLVQYSRSHSVLSRKSGFSHEMRGSVSSEVTQTSVVCQTDLTTHITALTPSYFVHYAVDINPERAI